MKRAVFLICTMFLFAVTSWGQTWKLSETMTVTLNDAGVLTVSTTSDSDIMRGYNPPPPWYADRLKILSIVIENKIKNIASDAFVNCSNLTSVIIGNSLDAIGISAFENCSSLSSVIVGNSLEYIAAYAFANCSSLTSVTIPISAIEIGYHAFIGCNNMKEVAVKWTTPLSVPDDIFELVPISSATLLVPAGTKALYEADPVWGSFGTIKETTVVPEITLPTGDSEKGNISLSLFVPSDAALTGSFEIQFPDGMTLDEELTSLSEELAGDFSLSFTSKRDNTWLIEINPKTLRNSASISEYRKIMDIAYGVDKTVTSDVYEVKITNLDFMLNDGTPIQEDMLTVPVYVIQGPTSVEFIPDTPFRAYFVGNLLRIESLQAESIEVYSVMGVQMYSTVKNVGMIEIPFPSQNGTIYIIRGSASGTVKIIKQN